MGRVISRDGAATWTRAHTVRRRQLSSSLLRLCWKWTESHYGLKVVQSFHLFIASLWKPSTPRMNWRDGLQRSELLRNNEQGGRSKPQKLISSVLIEDHPIVSICPCSHLWQILLDFKDIRVCWEAHLDGEHRQMCSIHRFCWGQLTQTNDSERLGVGVEGNAAVPAGTRRGTSWRLCVDESNDYQASIWSLSHAARLSP